MDQERKRLVKTLGRMISILESFGEEHWRAWMVDARARLLDSDYSGIERLLKAYGGMGSFNDLVVGQELVDGRLRFKPGAPEANKKLSALRSQAFEIANSIRRNQELKNDPPHAALSGDTSNRSLYARPGSKREKSKELPAGGGEERVTSRRKSTIAKFDLAFFFIAPVIMLASTVIKSFDGVKDIKSGILSGMVQAFAFVAYVFVFDRLLDHSSEQLPLFSASVRILFVLSCFIGFCFGLDAILLELSSGELSFWGVPGARLFAFLGPVWPLSLLTTGIVFWWKRIVPVHLALLLALCGLAFPAGRIPGVEALYYVADGMFLMTFWMLGRHLSTSLSASPR